MLLAGAGGYLYLSSGSALFAYLKTNAYHLFANYTLSVIPLFILMGALAERRGLAQRPVPRRRRAVRARCAAAWRWR